jgi:PII-like signaling protein
VHRTHLVAEDAPETVVLVDRPEAIDRFVAEMQSLLAGLLVVVDDVEIVEPAPRRST